MLQISKQIIKDVIATLDAYGCGAHHSDLLPLLDQPEVEPVAIGMRDATYKDSTPKLHVGSSSFEDWFQAQEFATLGGIKQMCRDSYAAGMGDSLVTAADITPAMHQEWNTLFAVGHSVNDGEIMAAAYNVVNTHLTKMRFKQKENNTNN